MIRRTETTPDSDEALVALLRQGHQPALGVIWDRYAHLLFGVGMKYLKNTDRSKDAVAEVFAVLPDLLAKHKVDRFRPWLHTVMRNKCLMELRGPKPTITLDDQIVTADMIDADDALLHECTLQRLEHAITELKEVQRICIELFYLKNLSYQIVADRTQLPIATVRSHLQNGRRNLKLILERAGKKTTRSNVQ